MPGDHRPPGGVGNMLPKTVTDDVRKSDQRCIEAVVSFRADESALDIQESLELGLGMMKPSGARPPVRAREDGLVAVLRPDTFNSPAIRSMTSSHETSTKGSRPRSPPRPSSQPARTAGLSIRAVPFRLPAMLSFSGDGSGSDGCPRTDVTRPLSVVTSPIPQWLDVSARSTVPSTSVIPGLPVEENAWHIARELSLALPARTWLAMTAFPAGCHPAGRGKTAGPATRARRNGGRGNPRTGNLQLTSAFPPLPGHGRAARRATARIYSIPPVPKMTAGLVKATKTSSVVS